MPQEIYCRMATPADIPALVALLKELTELEADFSFAYEEHCAGLRMLIDAQPAVCVLVACTVADVPGGEGELVGMCTGQPVISTAAGAFSVWVEDVVITGTRRGSGIDKRLLVGLEEWARGRGAARMQLLADKDNQRALEFYQRQGWRPTNFVCWRKMLDGRRG